MRAKRQSGQALVEFSIAVFVFLILLMGIVDFAIAIYKYNGVSQAAREIARVTSVHPGTTLGSSPEIAAVVSTQKGLIPGLSNPTFSCVDPVTNAAVGTCNYTVDSVRVTISAPYTPVTPLLGLIGTWTMEGTSSAQIQ
ncbi:MAG: TadE/TadG family type IV pilus assembly protein [Chloroflexota bacterium]